MFRTQARNGIALPIGQPHKKGAAGRPHVPPVLVSASSKKPKVAPMMAKTLRMARGMKGSFRR
jgi:hypothetical protein